MCQTDFREVHRRLVVKACAPPYGRSLGRNLGNNLSVGTLICGETDNYGFRFPAERGTAMIETSHEVSEVRGLRMFAEVLGRELYTDAHFPPTACT